MIIDSSDCVILSKETASKIYKLCISKMMTDKKQLKILQKENLLDDIDKLRSITRGYEDG